MDARIIDRESARQPSWRAAEFFAGIGLARLGMSRAGIEVVWSNDIAKTKMNLFRRNFESSTDHTFVLKDLGEVDPGDLPENLDLAWASFPCTDLSVAGARAGLHRGAASSTFWHFVKLLSKMKSARPRIVALENVTAFATSHDGRDIFTAIKALNGLGYSVDVLQIDAIHFVPQSRPRLFLVGVLNPSESSATHSSNLRPAWLNGIFDDRRLRTHRFDLPELPEVLVDGLVDYLEHVPRGDARWWSADRVEAYESSLSAMQLSRYDELRHSQQISYRTAYRRMRSGVPRWEMRSDGVSGCLRTSSGGSSKQAVLEVGRGNSRIRWMTPREYASLMGAPTFPLQGVVDHHAYSGFGDAVCAPVVTWLSKNYLIPLLDRVEAQVA